MKESPDEFKSRVYAVAFTESVHSQSRIPDSAGTFFAEVLIAFILSTSTK